MYLTITNLSGVYSFAIKPDGGEVLVDLIQRGTAPQLDTGYPHIHTFYWVFVGEELHCPGISSPGLYQSVVRDAQTMFPNVRLDCGALEESTMSQL